MSSVNATDITTLLERWSEAKKEMTELEKKVEKYKRLANRVMEQQGVDEFSSQSYTLKKKKITRKTISKQDVPKDVWEKYGRSISYTVYYLIENK